MSKLKEHEACISIPDPDNRGFHWAYANYEATPEDREAVNRRFRELFQKAAQDVEDRVMKAMLGQ